VLAPQVVRRSAPRAHHKSSVSLQQIMRKHSGGLPDEDLAVELLSSSPAVHDLRTDRWERELISW
jgi:hypothetical protein